MVHLYAFLSGVFAMWMLSSLVGIEKDRTTAIVALIGFAGWITNWIIHNYKN